MGYIYIPDMGPEGLNEFARYFYPQLDKEALIIDDRANGGGNVSPMIIERLLRKPYRMTMYRTSSKTGTIPDATQYGPKVLLVNKYSASDGDLFPWSFKANGIGTVIGSHRDTHLGRNSRHQRLSPVYGRDRHQGAVLHELRCRDRGVDCGEPRCGPGHPDRQ